MKSTFLKRFYVLSLSAAFFVPSLAFAQTDFNCEDFGTQEEAQTFFEEQGGPQQDSYRLDSDGDGKACEQDEGIECQPLEPGSEVGNQTVVGIAANTPCFSALFNAIDVAELSEVLEGPGPFTIFAPTNEAFAKLSESERDALLADRETLRRVLSYHVVPGSFTTADITEDMTGFTTLLGSDLPITSAGVGDAAVTAIDLLASNGVFFAIDTVLTPPNEAATEAEPAPEDTLYAGSSRASERFDLTEVGGSGVAGSVLVAEYEGERAVVTVSLSGTPAGGEHPAALYTGSCEMFSGDALSGDPVAELEPVSGDLGFSTTVTDLTFEAIVSGDHALAVGLSADDPTVVACGEVGQ